MPACAHSGLLAQLRPARRCRGRLSGEFQARSPEKQKACTFDADRGNDGCRLDDAPAWNGTKPACAAGEFGNTWRKIPTTLCQSYSHDDCCCSRNNLRIRARSRSGVGACSAIASCQITLVFETWISPAHVQNLGYGWLQAFCGPGRIRVGKSPPQDQAVS